ncbi:SpoIIE family protein phosphatase [Piscibacillus salipiscarius]|uniref:SpoIIE family protein phosphatase n=1 Tax=Piscibacillus salipiscarius TaxID=299480 RepID=UPI0006D2470C|nr:SpoIIE family protein phosphatase [Piscibacillus salipiscarius]
MKNTTKWKLPHLIKQKGNYYSGDSYYYVEFDDFFIAVLADGLGSGELARKSSSAVINIVKENPHDSLDDLLTKCNEVFFNNELRGCVIGLLKVDYKQQTYSYVSFGNIGIIIVTEGKKKRNIPVSGYLSGIPINSKVHSGELTHNAVFFMFSDGVNERQLTNEFYKHKSMSRTIEWYTLQQKLSMEDDTTLIAMRYKG